MGEIGSRAIHRYVCFSLPLSRRTNESCARLCWFQSARRLAFERNTRERRERKVYEETPIPIGSGKAIASSSRFRPPKTRFVRELFSTFQSPKEAKSADDDFVCSFVRPLFSVALACFCLLTNTLSLSLCFSLW